MALESLNIPDWLLGASDDHTVAATMVATLLAVMETAGNDSATLLKNAGIDASELQNADNRISYRAYLRLCCAAIDRHPVAEVCLPLGEQLNISALGTLGLGLLNCKTCREAFQLALKYRSTLGVPTTISLETESDRELLVVDEPFKPLLSAKHIRALFYSVISCVFHNGRYLVGGAFRFEKICLNLETAEDNKVLADYFGCEVISNAGRNCVAFNKALMNAPIQYASPSAKKITDPLCQELSSRLHRQSSIAQQVAKLLLKRLHNPPNLSEVAGKLDISSRSLSRQLLNEGLSFQLLLDELRKTNAKLLLREHRLTMEAVAHAVGFSDVANFRRAFKKWTNITPAHYRNHCHPHEHQPHCATKALYAPKQRA